MAAVADLRCSLLCRRLALSCQNLVWLKINMDSDASEEVLKGFRDAQRESNRINMKLYVTGR